MGLRVIHQEDLRVIKTQLIADEVNRRLMSGQQQEYGIRQYLMARVSPTLLATGDHGQQVITWIGQPFLDNRGKILHQPTDGCRGRLHAIGLAAADED